MEKDSIPQKRHSGFDAPVSRSVDDHLGRWPLAREIYSVAVNGPSDWPVRIGVYGEWGTGKTSVLEFVASMAESEDHIVVWFDPWAFHTKSELWKAFVLTVCSEVESKLGGITAAGDARKKGKLASSLGVFKSAAKFASEGTQELVGHGLDYLRKLFEVGPKDIAKLRQHLGDHRVVVLIDDLDRTAPELVPEILFALKEVMNLPGFAYVCGFDPVVVGKVLGRYHAGFGDGLQFLEKIIDYPVHLPPVTAEGLAKLASSEGRLQCPFVPEHALREAVPLLPQNPRATRQFIRMLALLRTQIGRHYEHELRWPVIIAAAVMRIRYPRAARILFQNESFWTGIHQDKFSSEGSEKRKKVDVRIAESVGKVVEELKLSQDDSERLQEGLRRICAGLGSWLSSPETDVFYQIAITESPHAVTWKEFDELIEQRIPNGAGHDLNAWIKQQAARQHRTPAEVGRELFAAAVERFSVELQGTLDAFRMEEAASREVRAEANLVLLEELMRIAEDSNSALAGPDWIPLGQMIEKFASFAGFKNKAHAGRWQRCRTLLHQAVAMSAPNESLVMEAVKPFDEWRWERTEARALHRELRHIVLEHFAKTACGKFEDPGFIERVSYQGTGIVRRIVLQADGPLWKGQRKLILATLRKSKANSAVQENAYALLRQFEYLLREEKDGNDAKEVEKLLRLPAILNAIWGAATARLFSEPSVYRMRQIPELFASHGGTVKLPRWWKPSIVSFVQRLGIKHPDLSK